MQLPDCLSIISGAFIGIHETQFTEFTLLVQLNLVVFKLGICAIIWFSIMVNNEPNKFIILKLLFNTRPLSDVWILIHTIKIANENILNIFFTFLKFSLI